MTDIVDQLRALDMLRAGDTAPSWEHLGKLGNEAADEIQRLRAALSALSQVAGAVSIDGFNYSDFKRTGDGWPARKIIPDPNGEVS